MSIVPTIFAAFGGVSKLADATGSAQQTASEWLTRDPPEIPPWRRPSILAAARRLNDPLPPEALAYLQSTSRTPKSRPSEQSSAAAL